MFWFIVTALCIVGVLAGIWLHRLAKKQAASTKQYDVLPTYVGWIVIAVSVAVFVFFTVLSSVHFIGQLEVGVVYTFGEVTGQISPGAQVTAPWQSVHKQSTGVEKFRVENHEGFSSETQPVYYTATLNWHVEPSAVQELYKSVGPNFFDRIIPARVDQAFKSETVKYAATDIAPHREQIKENILSELKRTLAVYAISADDLNIDNLYFEKAFQDAIIAKQVAAQAALTAQNKVKQAEYEADQLVKAAQGKAEAIKIEGEMLAKYPGIIQMRAIEKLNDNVSVMLLPSGSNFLLPGSLLEKAEQK